MRKLTKALLGAVIIIPTSFAEVTLANTSSNKFDNIDIMQVFSNHKNLLKELRAPVLDLNRCGWTDVC